MTCLASIVVESSSTLERISEVLVISFYLSFLISPNKGIEKVICISVLKYFIRSIFSLKAAFKEILLLLFVIRLVVFR